MGQQQRTRHLGLAQEDGKTPNARNISIWICGFAKPRSYWDVKWSDTNSDAVRRPCRLNPVLIIPYRVLGTVETPIVLVSRFIEWSRGSGRA